MIYPIVIYGSDVLRKPCERITPDYPEVKKLVEDMFLTLGEAEGVGLAAPQIGKNIRLFIVDCTPWGEDDPECADYKRAFINPEIYALSEEKKTYNEGCLSFPGIHADVPRSLAIRMRYMDEDFVEHDEEFHGLKAWVIQHEYDHIEGIVFTDRISPLRRNLLKGKLMNLAKGKYRCAYKTNNPYAGAMRPRDRPVACAAGCVRRESCSGLAMANGTFVPAAASQRHSPGEPAVLPHDETGKAA